MSAERQNCEASREPLLGNSSINTHVATQWLNSHHVKASIDMHTTTEELWEVVSSVQSMPRLYNEDQLPLAVNQ
jgi:hypothetical protein